MVGQHQSSLALLAQFQSDVCYFIGVWKRTPNDNVISPLTLAVKDGTLVIDSYDSDMTMWKLSKSNAAVDVFVLECEESNVPFVMENLKTTDLRGTKSFCLILQRKQHCGG